MSDLNAAIAAIWRIESPKLIARLVTLLGDLQRAEDAAQDAFVSALATWPGEGIPRNPGAWLTTAAKRRAIDAIRRSVTRERLSAGLAYERTLAELESDVAASYHEVSDDVLRLMFLACHPAVSADGRIALTLKLVGGLTTLEIARAFLTSEATMAQRIVRAKRALAAADNPLDLPTGTQRNQRLAAVLSTIYLIFNEGYAATSGDDVLRPELVEDALRLGRMLAALEPTSSEVHGLVALMELQSSRLHARVDAAGEPILLFDQDRSRWNRLAIERGRQALLRARNVSSRLGPYGLQAEIAYRHATAPSGAQTDWHAIVACYDALEAAAPSPVVRLNRAVAIGMALGPQAGLDAVEPLLHEPALRSYHLLPSVRGDLLAKLGRTEEAREAFRQAAALAGNRRDRELLLRRATEV